MKTLTYNDINSLKLCYPLSTSPMEESWEGTCVDIINIEGTPLQDKVFVICRDTFISEEYVTQFMHWLLMQVVTEQDDCYYLVNDIITKKREEVFRDILNEYNKEGADKEKIDLMIRWVKSKNISACCEISLNYLSEENIKEYLIQLFNEFGL